MNTNAPTNNDISTNTNTQRALYGLILATAAIMAAAFATDQNYTLALLALGIGAIWLALEMNLKTESPAALFLLFFGGMAVFGSADGLSPVLMLLGLCAALAAWDVSRFRSRVLSVEQTAIPPELEAGHLRKLAITVGAGFVVALLPLVTTISINFVALAVLLLATLFVLRASIIRLRAEE